ncbi:FecR domain-containing protein [Haloferula sp. BvORR071]|uniref:FecR domain-containing protein n=1 Tax=Haloferula sp. BvORR071 TaxID=1396141 RepID=UPI0005596D24|nr:FecR domain-containing protein [Haloferula sp. BvORR071]
MKHSSRLNLLLSSLVVLAAAAPAALHAEPGSVEAIRGDSMYVRDGMMRRMAVAATLQGGDGVHTGKTGQTQVDAGGATVRAGSNTDLALKKNRQGLTLKEGIVLVSNKSQSSGFELETDRHRATSYGTMQVSYLKDKYLKVLCVEGKVKVSLKALMGDSVTLKPGQMVTITPTEERIQDPATVNLNRVAATSALMGPSFVVPKLNFPGGNRVGAAIAAQEQAVASATGRVGDNTREKTLSDTDKTLGILTGPAQEHRLGSQFNAALNGKPATPERMYDIFYWGSKGLYRPRPGNSNF